LEQLPQAAFVRVKSMRPVISCSGIAAVLVTWVLVMPPFSVTPAGKNFVDTRAPLYRWETLSSHPDSAACIKHRDQMRESLEKTAASNVTPTKKGSRKNEKAQAAFAGLRERLAGSRCVSSTDPLLHTPAPTPKAK
jgi:hypothetical protein